MYRVDLCSVMSMSGQEPALVPLVSGSVTTAYADSPDTIAGAIFGEASVLLTQVPICLPLGNVTFWSWCSARIKATAAIVWQLR